MFWKSEKQEKHEQADRKAQESINNTMIASKEVRKKLKELQAALLIEAALEDLKGAKAND